MVRKPNESKNVIFSSYFLLNLLSITRAPFYNNNEYYLKRMIIVSTQTIGTTRQKIFITLLALLFIWLLLKQWQASSFAVHGKVITAPNPALRIVANDIARNDKATQIWLGQMAEYLRQSYPLKFGLALPQLGIPRRGFVVVIKHKPVIMINPVIQKITGNRQLSFESCLSIPGTEGYVYRNDAITVTYYDQDWNLQTLNIVDIEAFIIQHEYDHLQGILFTDKLVQAENAKDNTNIE